MLSVEHIDNWKLLLQDPLAVSTDALSKILTLERITSASPKPPKGFKGAFFYIREFTMTAGELSEVLTRLLYENDNVSDYKGVFAWLERLQNEPADTYFTLRYCGQTKKSPWIRHLQDVKKKSNHSCFGKFLQIVRELYPPVLEEAVIYSVSGACTEVPLSTDILDQREQVLIALFGHGLLNTESGGKITVLLNDTDKQLFLTLKTNAVARLANTNLCFPTTLKNITAYAKEVRQYVANHPTTTKTKGRQEPHVYSDQMEALVVKQGIPRVLSDGSAILVTLGSDMGALFGVPRKPFFESDYVSAVSMNMIINQLGHWEQPFGSTFNDQLTKQLAGAGKLPFADLFPWPVKHDDDFEQAGRLTVQYMEAVRPMLIMTYGRLVCWRSLFSKLR